MVKQALAKAEQCINDKKNEMKSLQKAHSSLLLEHNNISKENDNLKLVISKLQLDLDHERNQNYCDNPFDRLKHQQLQSAEKRHDPEVDPSPYKGLTSDDSSYSDYPSQIKYILGRLDSSDEDESFGAPPPPPSTQNQDAPSENGSLFKAPLNRKRKHQSDEQIVPSMQNEGENCVGPSSGYRKKRSYKRETGPKKKKENIPPEISSSIPETPENSPV